MTCDYRIMSEGKHTIGLNETQLGIVAPFWFIDTFKNTIGHRKAEQLLALGTLLVPDEAYRVGLIDEVVPADKVLERSTNELMRWISIPNQARIITKQRIRQEYIDKLLHKQSEDREEFIAYVTSNSVQKGTE